MVLEAVFIVLFNIFFFHGWRNSWFQQWAWIHLFPFLGKLLVLVSQQEQNSWMGSLAVLNFGVILVLSMIGFFVLSCFLIFLVTFISHCYVFKAENIFSARTYVRYLSWKYKYIVLRNVPKQFLCKFKICASGIIRTLRFSVAQEVGRLLWVK